ncbi:hypothetical protein [Morganella psychrotolerans]|uniref:hypothetical protein n=1 Tax=Morganella psychrotolerans TaxID=368603 RepID=UPI0039B02D92
MYDAFLMMENTARCQRSRRNVSIPGFLHKYRMSIQVLVKNSGMLIIQSAPVHRGPARIQKYRNREPGIVLIGFGARVAMG